MRAATGSSNSGESNDSTELAGELQEQKGQSEHEKSFPNSSVPTSNHVLKTKTKSLKTILEGACLIPHQVGKANIKPPVRPFEAGGFLRIESKNGCNFLHLFVSLCLQKE